MRKLYRSLLATGVVFGLAACGDDVSVTPPADPTPIAITGISVSPSNATIPQNTTIQLSASVQTNGGDGEISLLVTWASSNPQVASVNASTGQVTGVAPGTATITATSVGNPAYSAGSAIVVQAPPVTPNALLGLTVNPTAASVQAGNQVAISTNSSLSPGGSVSYANSSNNANCTVPLTGANPTVTAVTVGTCVITITATGSGTGLLTNVISASVAITITNLGPALQSLTINPTSWNTWVSTPNRTQVVTTIVQAAAGVTPTWNNASSNNAVATVSNGANPTITAVGNGTAQITIQANGAGPNLVSNSLVAIVQVNVSTASVSIATLTTCIDPDGPLGPLVCAGPTPVNVNAAFGQIEATMNISSGNQQLGSVAVFLGPPTAANQVCAPGDANVEAARQIFGVNGAPNAPVSLSINTADFDGVHKHIATPAAATFAATWRNGPTCIEARVFPADNPQLPLASNTQQFTLANPDVVYFTQFAIDDGAAGGLDHTGNSALQAAGAGAGVNRWWRGGFTFRANPVLYSGAANVVSIAYTSTLGACGTVLAVAAPWTATFPCAGAEATQNIAAAVAITYVAGYTITASPVAFMTAATAGFVPGNPVFAAQATFEDNVGPRAHTPIYVAPGAGGWHGNGSAGTAMPTAAVGGSAVIPPTSYTATATDFGVGGGVAASTAINGLATAPNMTELTLPVGPFAHTSTPFGIPLPETLIPSPYNLRGNGLNDILGNVGVATTTAGSVVACGAGVPTGSTSVCGNSSVISGVFGVDLVVLDAQYADRATSATVGVVWQGLQSQIYVATANAGGASPGVGATGIVVCEWDGITAAVGCPAAAPDAAAENVIIDAIDSRSGLNNPTALTQKIQRSTAAGTANCAATPFGTYAMATILADNYVQSAPQQLDCGLAAGARVGEYTWFGYVSDRAANARFANSAGSPPMAGTVNFLRIAIDEALPNITGIGFQTTLYTGGLPATYSFSANDDLELWQGQVTLTYGGHAPVTFPYGSSAYTTGAFGTPFDGTFANVVNGAALTIGYYINQYDFTTGAAFVPGGAPSGNVAGFASGTVNTGVTANIRDVAAQPAAVPLVAPVLVTQLTVRAGAPAYGTMIDFRIITKTAANVLTVQDVAPSSVGLAFCDRVDIYEAAEAAPGDIATAIGLLGPGLSLPSTDASITGLIYRSTVTSVPVPGAIPDNGFQRFLVYTSAAHTNVASGLYVAACIKSGSALMSPVL